MQEDLIGEKPVQPNVFGFPGHEGSLCLEHIPEAGAVIVGEFIARYFELPEPLFHPDAVHGGGSFSLPDVLVLLPQPVFVQKSSVSAL